jgi:hypothetical protein
MRNKELEERSEKLAREFFELCNIMSSEDQVRNALTDALDRQHRTVIQNAMGVLRDVIKHYAEFHGSDLRNQDSHEWAKKVTKDSTYFRYV